MDKRDNLTGRKFGRLLVLSDTTPHEHLMNDGEHPIKRNIVECLCQCGNKKTVLRDNLINERTKSCGCMKSESMAVLHAKFINDKVWKHENTLDFQERDSVVKGTRITSLRSDRTNKNNTSGVRGVHWDKSRNKWSANLWFKGKQIRLGRFALKQDAINARKEAEQKYFQPLLEKYDNKPETGEIG